MFLFCALGWVLCDSEKMSKDDSYGLVTVRMLYAILVGLGVLALALFTSELDFASTEITGHGNSLAKWTSYLLPTAVVVVVVAIVSRRGKMNRISTEEQRGLFIGLVGLSLVAVTLLAAATSYVSRHNAEDIHRASDIAPGWLAWAEIWVLCIAVATVVAVFPSIGTKKKPRSDGGGQAPDRESAQVRA
jgi:hypothetical protein